MITYFVGVGTGLLLGFAIGAFVILGGVITAIGKGLNL